MSGHTPTPWSYERGDDDDLLIGPDRGMIAEMYDGGSPAKYAYDCAANAAFIVKAVNAHADLIAALTRISRLLSAASSSDDHTRLHKALDTLDEARSIAREAIARAEDSHV